MPEIKSTFVAGRMNKSLDERLVPKGEYRDAMNIDISTSEDSDVGAAQNCMGNSLIDTIGISGGFCVGSVTDAKNDKIYWFIAGTNVDAIAEYNPNKNGGSISPILVDVKATSGGILNFSSAQQITGINIIDEYLFWTDNINEPKKININRSKQGCIKKIFIRTTNGDTTYDITDSTEGANYDLTTKPSTLNTDFTSSLAVSSYNSSTGILTLSSNPGSNASLRIDLKLKAQFLQHTRLFVNNTNKGNIKEKHITVIKRYPLKAPTITLNSSDRDGNIINMFCSTPDESHDAGSLNNWSFWAYKTTTGNILPKPIGTSFDPLQVSGSTLTDNLGRDVLLSEIEFQTTLLRENDVVKMKATDSNIDYEVVLELEEETTIANASNQTFKCSILNISNTFANSDKDLALNWTVNLEQEDPIYELVFPRFAYRWRYADGEYSTLSPFTEVAFLPDEITGYKFDAKTGHNLAMKNIVRKVTLSDFGDYMTAVDSDIVFLDILMKESDKTNIYIVKSIDITEEDELQTVDIKAESVKSLLPENQILRPYDNVPRKALAQEVAGNRLVYGNYVQGQTHIPQDSLKIFTRAYSKGIKNEKPTPSLKSIRDYEVGISYLDEYGRQTPVFVSKDGGSVFKIPQSRSDKDNYIRANVENAHPPWATHYKFYIKEPSEEYYNLPLDRVYLSEEEGTAWLSFVSADANKVSLNEYIILKKKHGSNKAIFNTQETMVEDGDISKTIKYKVLDKKSQAPDYVRNRKEIIGKTPTQFGCNNTSVYDQGFPVEQTILLTIPAEDIVSSPLENMHTLSSEKKYIKISTTDGNICSKYYEVESIEAVDGGTGGVNTNSDNDRYEIRLKQPLSTDVAFTGTFASPTANLQLELYVEKEEEYLSEEFQGRFFVKIKIDETFDENVIQTESYRTESWIISHRQNIFNIVNTDITSSSSSSVTFGDDDFTPSYVSNSNSTNGQEYAIDNGFGFEPSWNNGSGTALDPNDPDYVSTSTYSGVQGKGWESGNTVDLRFFGTLDQEEFPVPGSSFYPNTQPLYEALTSASVGNPVYFRWKDEVINTSNTQPPIYKITNCVEIPVDNVSGGSSNTFGIRLRLTIENHTVAQTPGVNWNPTDADGDGTQDMDPYNVTNVPYDASGPSLTHAKELQILDRHTDSRTFSTDSPAVFETEPKKLIDLNIFHETSEAVLIPKVGMTLTSTAANFPDTTVSSIGFGNGMVKILTADNMTGDVVNNAEVTFSYPLTNANSTNFSYGYKVFGGGTNGIIASGTNVFYLKAIELNWHNCFAFGNGVESNRIRDDFNAPFIDNGPKVSTITEEDYREERRNNGLIYSGLYNSNSDFNNLNQFIQAEKITKDLNPSYGSIQKLFTRNTNIVVFCEDKTLKVLANKDALFNADGNANLTSTNKFLGQTIPFVGDYGISKNPESFASYGYRVYYADKNRNAVLRLSGDGITNIAEKGMSNYFKDNLYKCSRITGSYDEDKNLYNITLQNTNLTINDTVSFTEKTNGWTSFKSFKPESGVSLNSKYYTFYNGDIYEHGANSLRNTFYDTFTESSIKLIVNDMPSSIKEFKSLNYEGTVSRLYNKTAGSETNLETDKNLTSTSGKGWYNSSIETDKQSGSIAQFTEKEGKWYSYIKGIDTTVANIDTKEFSIQGLGALSSISGVGWSVTYKLNITGKIAAKGNDATFGNDYLVGEQEMFSWEETTGTSFEFDPNVGVNDITKEVNVPAGSYSQSHVFTISGNTVLSGNNTQSQFLIRAEDFSVDTSFNSGSEESSDPVISGGGIGTISFANTTSAYAEDNKVTVTVPFSFTMPSADQAITFRVKGSAIMTQTIT